MAYIKKINGYVIKDQEARDEIDNIKNGNTTVENAKNATNAANASNVTSTINGVFITDIFTTDSGATVAKKALVANKATSDENGKNIAGTYATKAELEGKQTAYVFETEAAMQTALASAEKNKYKIGNQLLIKATDVPDYWVSAVNETKSGNYGYYEISILETEKVDLSDYAKTAEVAKIKAVSALPATGDTQTIYLIPASGGSSTIAGQATLTGVSDYGGNYYSYSATGNIGAGWVNVTAIPMTVGAKISRVTYDSNTGSVTVSGTHDKEGLVKVKVSYESGDKSAAIYENNKWTYIPLADENGIVTAAFKDGYGNIITDTYLTINDFAASNVTFSLAGEELTIMKGGSKPFSA